VATARLRLSRLIPHSTAWHCLYRCGSNPGGRAAGAAFVLAVADLVGLLRDGAGNLPPSQVGAVGAGPVRLVGQHPARPRARVPAAGPGDPDALQHGLELGAVPALARGDQHRQRLLVLLVGQVHLGGQPAPRPSQAVIVRLVTGAAGRFGLQVPLFRAPAACLCARATVESTDTSQVISPAASARA